MPVYVSISSKVLIMPFISSINEVGVGAAERHGDGVVPPPPDPHGPGEMGKPVKIENPEPAVKKLIDEGWQKNAFNQYVSDMISVHRSLPDPR